MLLYKTNRFVYVDLQSDINSLNNWVSSNHLDFQHIRVQILMEQVESVKYLGLLLSSDLSWAQYSDTICAMSSDRSWAQYIDTICAKN